MSSKKTSRNRKARKAFRSSLQLECLESRLPLAGNVTAQLIGSTLFLTGAPPIPALGIGSFSSAFSASELLLSVRIYEPFRGWR